MRAVKFDKDIMALLKATKKASKAPAEAIAQRRKTHRKSSPPNEYPAPDQNIEPPPGVDTAQRFETTFSEPAGDLYLPPVTEKWSADGTL
jgi:hypothetical protein